MSEQLSIIHSLRILLPLVPRREKIRFCWLLILAVVAAISELVLTGFVALLAAIFGSPETVLNNPSIHNVVEYLGLNFSGDTRPLALTALCGVLFMVILRNLFTLLQQRHMVFFSESVGAAARMHIFRFYQRAPFMWIIRNGVADLGFGLSCATALAGTLSIAINIFSSILMIATLFIGLVIVSPVPSLMFLLILGCGGTVIVKLTRQYLDRCSREVYDVDYRTAKIGHLALHGLKEMRMYGREDNLFTAYAEQLGEAIKSKAKQGTVARLPVSFLEILGFSILVGVMLFLIFVQDAGMARISGIMGFMAATAWRSLPVANRLVDAVSGLRAGLPYLRKTVELLNLEKSMTPELLALDVTPPPLPFEKSIILDHMFFRYPKSDTPAVDDVSFTIPAGSMVGLIGLSGAGKSTLVNLMTGLMPPESGRLLVDGVEISKENVRSWLGRIGYVAQAPYILDATLAENVALSRWGETINRERVLECCRMAALDFLDALERGIDTPLGDRGTRLSGGQAQRVAIARALYSEPDLIIFDEATSALDMKNEKAIHETILSLRSKVTMVVIAHRLTTVEGCDVIVWMDKGKVLKTGGTEEILPAYRAALQSDKEKTRADDKAGQSG